MSLPEIQLRLVTPQEQARFQELMAAHHYLGALPKIGRTLRYVASGGSGGEQWLALLVFSAAALKCAARDEWIGWDFRWQYDRLHLVANNSRLLILPDCHYRNLASRVLSLAEARLATDWPRQFGYRRLGQTVGAESAGTLRLSPRKRPPRRAHCYDHPRRAHPRRSRRTRPVSRTLEPTIPPARRKPGHRRQNHAPRRGRRRAADFDYRKMTENSRQCPLAA
jgi:hypothetical protein